MTIHDARCEHARTHADIGGSASTSRSGSGSGPGAREVSALAYVEGRWKVGEMVWYMSKGLWCDVVVLVLFVLLYRGSMAMGVCVCVDEDAGMRVGAGEDVDVDVDGDVDVNIDVDVAVRSVYGEIRERSEMRGGEMGGWTVRWIGR